MKIYILDYFYDREGPYTQNVFSDLDKAKNSIKKDIERDYVIKEWEVDMGLTAKFYYDEKDDVWEYRNKFPFNYKEEL